jgi:hypothetical protein
MESFRPTPGCGLNGLSAREPDGLTRLMNREAASDIVDASLAHFKTAAVPRSGMLCWLPWGNGSCKPEG